MLLSKLIYLTIKNVIYFDDVSFTYDNFIKGLFDSDQNYANNINNVFTPVNEAIARLSDLDRIPFRIEEVNHTENVISLSSCSKQVKQVMNVALKSDNSFRKVQHRQFGFMKILIAGYVRDNEKVFIEYKEDIPQFDKSSFSYTFTENNGVYTLVNSTDIELREMGITDSMCNYIMEYAMGKLSEPIAAELANLHITRAEQYFMNISSNTSAFNQDVVETVIGIGD